MTWRWLARLAAESVPSPGARTLAPRVVPAGTGSVIQVAVVGKVRRPGYAKQAQQQAHERSLRGRQCSIAGPVWLRRPGQPGRQLAGVLRIDGAIQAGGSLTCQVAPRRTINDLGLLSRWAGREGTIGCGRGLVVRRVNGLVSGTCRVAISRSVHGRAIRCTR
jgi:hypothetical protein